MTDTIPRQDVIDAIEGERLTDATGHDGDIGYNQALDDALAAINAIPAVEVLHPTPELVKAVARKLDRLWSRRL